MESAQVDLFTIEEYVRLYEQDGPFEIIAGERKPIVPPVMLHILMIEALYLIMQPYCTERQLGRVFREAPFVLTYDSQWVKGSRVPDMMFITADRWQHYTATTPDWKQKPVILVPDLVIEIVSANDLYSDVQAKIAQYLQDGVKAVWVIDPHHQRADIYAGTTHIALNQEGVLNDDTLLPGLHVTLQDLFKDLDKKGDAASPHNFDESR